MHSSTLYLNEESSSPVINATTMKLSIFKVFLICYSVDDNNQCMKCVYFSVKTLLTCNFFLMPTKNLKCVFLCLFSSIIFVNNFAFGPEVDHQLKERFANMKEG